MVVLCMNLGVIGWFASFAVVQMKNTQALAPSSTKNVDVASGDVPQWACEEEDTQMDGAHGTATTVVEMNPIHGSFVAGGDAAPENNQCEHAQTVIIA